MSLYNAAEALRLLGQAPQNWVPVRPGIDHDVLVVGGGHSGSAFAFALQRAGISRFSVIDAAPDEASSGIWLTTARMKLLRTPKALPGPELGVQGLSFQAWYEAEKGPAAYAALEPIPRIAWAAYLCWYRRVLALPIRYGVQLRRIEPDDGSFRVHLDTGGTVQVETARKIILAHGFDASGYAYVPDVVASNLPRTRFSHTAERIDFTGLRGARVAILGAAASAFDAAATALEAGAAEVHLFARRRNIAATPVTRVRGYPGAYDNYASLPDPIRWRQALRFRDAGSLPPADAIARAVAFENFRIHLASPWHDAAVQDGEVVATTSGGPFRFDFVIAGTGYRVDLCRRPELAGFADRIALWSDRYTPPADEADTNFARHPYLGPAHEFLEAQAGSAPFLKDIHVFNPGAFVSFELPVGDVPSMRRDVPTIVSAISRDLFLADLAYHEQRMTGDIAPEFTPDAYAAAVWPAGNGQHAQAAE